ncbi:MAG: sensor histidine kinase [Actinomycetota bacterium]|nr:sensor histidine kinase [Actinomycetota bacterium]
MGGLALVTVRSQREARSQLEQRFVLRNALGASFAQSYATSVLRAERRLAEASLAGREVSERQFRGVVEALGFQAAVLLDRNGRLLQVWPPKPSILGTEIGSRYPHLRSALRGKPAVSNVVASASRGTPVVGFATPFETAHGRRVFSGAFGIGGTALDAYLSNALPFSGAELSLVDRSGALLLREPQGAADTTDLRAADPNLAAAVEDRASGFYRRNGEARAFGRHPVVGTPWSLVVSVPKGQLLAPVSGATTLIPWLLFVGFGVAAVIAAMMVWRLADHRARLALSDEQLARSNDELRDLDRIKDEFVALVSHELRTPLTSIIGYVSALKRGRAGVLAPEQHQLLEVVERNARRLVGLVSDLLTAAKADAGKLQLEPELVALDALVKDAVESARPHADNEGIELRVTASALVTVVADRLRLTQVLDNLIANAIKFTPPGGHVRVDLIANGPTASVTIEDNGIGIPEAEQHQLFRRFFRASTATSREIQGSGLGLSIVKTIIDLHGGTIAVTSSEGAGTTFTVTIPLAPAEHLAA